MKISTKGRYAIKLMLDLALYSKGQPVKIKEIAKRQGISEKYLEQIVATLNKAALVKSIRGSHGGYMLSEPPRNYTVGRILRREIYPRQTVLVPMVGLVKIRQPVSA